MLLGLRFIEHFLYKPLPVLRVYPITSMNTDYIQCHYILPKSEHTLCMHITVFASISLGGVTVYMKRQRVTLLFPRQRTLLFATAVFLLAESSHALQDEGRK